MISLLSDKSDKNGNCFDKYGDSLVYDAFYVEKMTIIILANNNSTKFMGNAKTK